MRRAQLLFAVSLVACGAAAPVTAPTGAGSDARPRSIGNAAKPETRASRAHWVPRVTQATYMRISPMTNKVFGPVRNNYGSLASTYLGTERVGFVDHGRRFVYDHRKLTAIDGERAVKKLERVEAIAGGLGGGFAFSGPNGVFFAETFEGPLRSLSTETGPFELAPSAIVMMPAGAVIATRTGTVVASAPKDIERVFTHRVGFTIVRSQTTAWLSTDSQKWRELRIGEVRDAAPDGEALLVATDRGSVRVKRDGSVAPAGLTDDEASERIMMSHLAVDEYLAADQGFEGTFVDAGYSPTGREPDEWFAVRHEQIVRVNTKRHEISRVALKPPAATGACAAGLLQGIPHLQCAELGKRLDLYRLDVATGALTREPGIEVKQGFASHIGSVDGSSPTTLMVMSTCDGDATGKGICVRDALGKWQTYQPPSPQGLLLPFPGEVLFFSETPDGALELRNLGKNESHVFPPAEVTKMRAAMGVTDSVKKGEWPAVVSAGYLRTPTGVRMFNAPTPFQPITKAVSYFVDLSFDKNVPPSVTAVEGVVATAGEHGLKIANGKLAETDDGWTTWTDVEDPPTGPLHDLAGAMCSDHGCVVGAWTRLGWSK